MEDIKKEVQAEDVEKVSGGSSFYDEPLPSYGYCPYTNHKGCTKENIKGFNDDNEDCRYCDERWF